MAMYTIIRVINRDHVDEHTNVGVGVYGEEGNLALWKADGPERALARGDLRAGYAEQWTQKHFEDFIKSAPSLDGLKKRLESMGHAMSYVQFRDPLWTSKADMESLLSIFSRFVLGKDKP